MALSDTIADLLTRIRNGKMAHHKYIDVALSKLNQSILDVLKKKGFVTHYVVNEKHYQIRVFLRYKKRRSLIHGIKRVSKPSYRIYVGYRKIPKVFSGLGIAILSTPAGILDGDSARESKVGGELLCLVW